MNDKLTAILKGARGTSALLGTAWCRYSSQYLEGGARQLSRAVTLVLEAKQLAGRRVITGKDIIL